MELLNFFRYIEFFFIKYSEKEYEILSNIMNILKAKNIRIKSEDSTELFNMIRQDSNYYEIIGKYGECKERVYYRDVYYELLHQNGYFSNNDIKFTLKRVQNFPLKHKYDVAMDTICSGQKGYKGVKNFELDGYYMYITDSDDYTYTVIDLDAYDMEKDELKLSRIKKIVEEISFLGKNNDCHNYAMQIAQLIPEGQIITSACVRFMNDNYYLHSYVEYNGYIIDLTFNIVMSKNDYYRLMHPIELSRINNCDIDSKKKEIESRIGSLEKLGVHEWSYILYIAFLNIRKEIESEIGNLDKISEDRWPDFIISALESLKEKQKTTESKHVL